MLYTVPDYYEEFSCIAGDCEDTCCAGWQIVIDKESMKKYKKVKGPYLKTLLKRVNWLQGTFRQDEYKRCAFLRDDNLCDMYASLGKDSLCKTCRTYPRHIEEFENVRETTLSVSCPEVARILMNRRDPVTFLSKEEGKEEIYDDFDPFLYSMLLDLRDAMIGILQDRSLDIKVRAGLLYGMARDVQRRVDRQEIFACQDIIEKYKKDSAKVFVQKQIHRNECEKKDLYMFRRVMLEQLHELELLKEDWYVQLVETKQRIFVEGSDYYFEIVNAFDRWIQEHDQPWKIQKEQLLVYFIFTYLCGAVYDGQVLPKVQMALISVDILEDMMMARWIRNESMLDTEDVIELVYRYSREVEHSDINLKRMEKLMPVRHGLYEKISDKK